MIAELGQVALMLALGLALLLAVLPLAGAQLGRPRWIVLARPLAQGQAVLLALATTGLWQALASNDFSVRYVAEHSNSLLPLHYRLSALWGGHEGSLLLWVLILAGWTLAVAQRSRGLPAELTARALGVLGIVSSGFLAFLLFTSNPFERALPGPADGRDLNPLLQDLGMIAHPPLLYMGYVGFSVVFALALAALLGGRLDAAWARWARPWTLAAWLCLTGGILLGSFWAYYELGWGGWWFWDAVENASFMPWLVGTALIHSLAVTEKRGSFKRWTVLLAILAFSLSLLGTFLVRSGVLSSVHAFASDPGRGLFILGILTLLIGGALAVYAWRAPQLEGGAGFAAFSRETLLLLNNVFLLTAAGTILLGTLYPLLLDALGLGPISVGAPYFETVFVPLMLPLLLLAGIGPFVAWRRGEPGRAWQRLRGLALSAAVVALVVWLYSRSSAAALLGLLLASWIVHAVVGHLWQRRRQVGWSGLRAQSAGYWGMQLAHLGLAVFVLGVTMVKGQESARDASLRVGETVALGGLQFRFAGLRELKGPNYVAAEARFEVTEPGQPPRVLLPQKRIYLAQQAPMSEAAIDRGLWRDLYVSLGDAGRDGRWQVRVQRKPLMAWIWLGALAMALGGGVAALDRRYRRQRVAASTPARLVEAAA